MAVAVGNGRCDREEDAATLRLANMAGPAEAVLDLGRTPLCLEEEGEGGWRGR